MIKIRKFSILLTGLMAVMAPSLNAKTAVEIVPMAVWQGRSQSLLNATIIGDLRKAWPDSRIAHVVSAAPFARGELSESRYKNQLVASITAGDDIVLHMAPWKSLADRASVSFRFYPTLFGVKITDEDCINDCGLELSFTAFSTSDIKDMIAVSRKFLAEHKLGSPAAVYFEEGVTSSSLQIAARQQGILQDWSGIEMSQMRASLGRFPIYQLNLDHVEQLPLRDPSADQANGLVLDHVRFGIHAEIADMESSVQLFKSAANYAKKADRLVRIPIIFNVDDLYYTQGFVREVILKAREVVTAAGVEVVPWTPQNVTWSIGRKPAVPSASSLVMATQKSENKALEPEFIPQDEADLEFVDEAESVAH